MIRRGKKRVDKVVFVLMNLCGKITEVFGVKRLISGFLVIDVVALHLVH
jgi:hypothetical protein